MGGTTKIRIVEDAEATGEVAQVYDEWRAQSGRRMVPGIYKCFSARPDVLRHLMAFGDRLHFSEGHLTRRMKEAIATYVSAINHCPYWIDSHAYFLRAQGADEQTVEALAQGKLKDAPVSAAERAMLRFAAQVTRRAHKTTHQDVERLRKHGWTDEQIAEAVYVIAMFAMMNRVADAFGVPPMGYRKLGKVTS